MIDTPPTHGAGTYAAALVSAHLEHAERRAIRHQDGGAMNYREVLDLSVRLHAGMVGRGLQPGDRVVIALDNGSAAILLERAVLLFGLVRVAVSARLHPEEISWIALDCDAALVAVEERHLAGVEPGLADRTVARRDADGVCWPDLLDTDGRPAPWPGVGIDDPAALMYTSGTTGRPKGAVTTQRAWLSMAAAVGGLLDVRPDDMLAHLAPFSHFSGSVASAYAIGGATITTLGRTPAAALPERLRSVGASCVPMVPTMLGDLASAHPAARLDLPDLRAVPYGGSAVAPTVLSKAHTLLGDVLTQFYGASEALIPVLHLSAGEHAGLDPDLPVPAGRAGSGMELALTPVAGPAGAVVGEGLERGELVVRGSRVMAGYWGRTQATDDVLEAGWYRTGDIVELDSSGLYTIIGRSHDVIITGGFNVYPAEVERVIAGISGVTEVCVVKVEHPRWGEGVSAMIVVDSDATVTEADVDAACRAHLADYKRPVLVRFASVLPHLSTGKVDTRHVGRLMSRSTSGTAH